MGEAGKPKTFKIRYFDLEFDKPLIILNEDDARELGISSGVITLLSTGNTLAPGIAMTSRTLVGPGEVGVTRGMSSRLKLEEGEIVGLRPLGIPPSFDALKKRIKGMRLSESEYRALIEDVVEGIYGEAEITAFLVSQIYYPLTDNELTYLIKAMVDAGTKITFEETAYDIHSIGGVPGNSKVALLSVPIVASAGLLIPKTSSRAITSPAGTADTMEVLARVDLEADEIVDIVRKTRGVLAWGGRLNLSPADDIFVNIERKIAIDPEQQMIASILSKKIAMGIERLVIDIPTGKGTKVSDLIKAEELAGHFIRQASSLNIVIKIAVTYGGQPIGTTAGPALEAQEALTALIERRGSRSLVDKAILLAGLVLEISGKAPPGMGEQMARDIFTSGKAYVKFREIVEAQGGNPDIKPDEIPLGKHTYTLTSPLEGAVTHIDNAAITLIARACGAPFDKGAGVRLHAKAGYRVNKDDPLITLYSNAAPRLESAIKLLYDLKPIMVEGMLLRTIP